MAASVADAASANPNYTKTLSANGGSTFFINGKPAFINGLRKLRNWPVIFLLVPFNKTPPSCKDLIVCIMPFISFLMSVINKPVIDESPF